MNKWYKYFFALIFIYIIFQFGRVYDTNTKLVTSNGETKLIITDYCNVELDDLGNANIIVYKNQKFIKQPY